MRRMTLVAVVAVTALAALAAGAANSAGVKTSVQARNEAKAPVQKAVFFAADGMRQDIVARYAAQGLMPTMSEFLKTGTSASGNGLLTQAPPNTGAGWYSLATGAWPGVHGSTNNTFHRSGQPFANRTAAFDPGVLQAESIAQSAERSGLKVAQVEWAGGRNATISGPTIDFQSFFSGRGVATNFIG
ncbi:MAG TPA: alkaline phosphatase family protein, partial [Gaiella sp.]|nr:alkaline phosphatase family protein [Gaiella sp.]